MSIQIFQRKILQFFKRFASDIADDIVRDLIVAHVHDPLRHHCNRYSNGNFHKDLRNFSKIYLPRSYDHIDRITGKDWDIQCKCDRDHGKHQ